MSDRDRLHGLSVADIHSLASAVVRNNLSWWPAGDRDDQHATAWEGIVLALLESDDLPSRRDLLEAGRHAVASEVRDQMRHHGKRTDGTNNGAHFDRYWAWHSVPSPSPEGPAVERLALAQIWSVLTERQRDSLNALAVSGDYLASAELLGIRPQTYRSLIGRARTEFRRWWHEGETPSGHFGCDRRALRHETSDPARLAVNARYAAQARERRKAAA